MAKPNFLVDAHEAALEDLALEVILGDGFFLLESEWQGKRVELWCKWASLKDDERLGAALEPKEDEAEYDYALRVGIEVCRVLGVKEGSKTERQLDSLTNCTFRFLVLFVLHIILIYFSEDLSNRKYS